MTNKYKKEPVIRFDGFTDDWEQRKLKDVSDYFNGGSFEESVLEMGELELVTLKSVNMQGELTSSGKFLNIDAPTLEKNTLIMILSEQSPGLLGMTSRIPVDNKYVLNQRVAEIKPKKDIDSNFLSKSINNNQQYFSKRGAGTKVQNISKPNVENFLLRIPKFEEQAQIGNFFKQLDETITLQERELVLLKELKKSLLQKMFPKKGSKVPEIRFAEFTDAWEQRKLGEVVDFFSGLTYSPENIQEDGTLVLRSSNVKNDNIISADDVFVDKSVVNSQQVEVGDIIVVVRNGSKSLIGKHAIVNKEMPNTVIGAFMTGIRSEKPNFINALLGTRQFNKEIEKNLGATINQITVGAFKKMTFMFSKDIEEQQKIGSFFKQLDETITLQERKLETLKNMKKSFLQKMFV